MSTNYEGIYNLTQVYDSANCKNLSLAKGRCDVVFISSTGARNEPDDEDTVPCYQLRLEKRGDGNEYRWTTNICNRIGGSLAISASTGGDSLAMNSFEMTQARSLFRNVMMLEQGFINVLGKADAIRLEQKEGGLSLVMEGPKGLIRFQKAA